MKILHTSDWHLGNRLMDKSRADEFRDFTSWILTKLKEHQVDILLISGDIFDNSVPGDTTLEIYHDFLSKADQSGCRYIIMTGGNHDGVSQLESSAPLLKRHHAYMVSSLKKEAVEDCLIPITDEAGTPQALVCAVPYLRPREVALPATTADEIAHAYTNGIASVYQQVAAEAEAWKAENPWLPVICMGHLSVSGAPITDSTQRIVGTIEEVSQEIFPAVFNYVALGHIHKGYSLNEGRVCYCGSPLPMGIDETENRHVCLVQFDENGSPTTQEIPVPLFTLPVRMECESQQALQALPAKLEQLAEQSGSKRICLQLVYTGTDISSDEVRRQATELFAPLYHYKVTMRRPGATPELTAATGGNSIHDFSPEEIFELMLKKYTADGKEMSDEESPEIRNCFNRILADITR